MSESRGCCRCCCSFIFTLGLTSLFMWLSLRASNPKCSIEYFYLPALNRSLGNSTGNNNNTLYFLLRLENPNKDKGINYDNVNVTVTVFDTLSRNHSVGTSVIPRFYQGHKKKAKKNGSIPFSRRVVLNAVADNGTAVFKVDMATAVRFKIMAWRTKRHRIRVGAEVKVNGNGTKDYHKNIKLKSSAHNRKMSWFVVVGVLVNFLVFVLLDF